MLYLYTSPICLYCRKVESYLHGAGIPYTECSITDSVHREELIQKGGMMQVPFLVDTDHDVSMYESDDMIAYLAKQYGAR